MITPHELRISQCLLQEEMAQALICQECRSIMVVRIPILPAQLAGLLRISKEDV